VQETRNKRQETKDKKQKTRNKRQETKDKNQGSTPIALLSDLGGETTGVKSA
jgi:hypothetical protein